MGLYDITIGALLAGVFFNTFLYGLVTYQFAVYRCTKFNDRPATKYMVLFLFLLDTFHSTTAVYSMWTYTVANFDNPAAVGLGLWPYQFMPIGTGLAALVTQIYLGFRIWRLTSSKFLYAVVIALAVSSFFLGVICTIETIVITNLSEAPYVIAFLYTWLSMQVVVDTLITVTLIIIFTRWRGGFRRTDTILNRLIRGAIQTGLFAGIFSVAALITFAVAPNTGLFNTFGLPIARIYTNTLMDTLLTRESLRAQMVATYDLNGAPDLINGLPADSSQSQLASAAHGAQIQVQRSILSSRENVEAKTAPPALPV